MESEAGLDLLSLIRTIAVCAGTIATCVGVFLLALTYRRTGRIQSAVDKGREDEEKLEMLGPIDDLIDIISAETPRPDVSGGTMMGPFFNPEKLHRIDTIIEEAPYSIKRRLRKIQKRIEILTLDLQYVLKLRWMFHEIFSELNSLRAECAGEGEPALLTPKARSRDRMQEGIFPLSRRLRKAGGNPPGSVSAGEVDSIKEEVKSLIEIESEPMRAHIMITYEKELSGQEGYMTRKLMGDALGTILDSVETFEAEEHAGEE